LDRARLARTMVLVTSLRGSVAALRRLSADSLAGAEFLFDAARQEIARVATLGVAGFDAPVSGDAIVESAAALEGVRDALAPWRALLADRDPARALDARFDAAIADLRTHPDFDSFDRFGFIVRFVQPLAHEVADMQRALRIEPPARRRAWSTRAASIYDADAVDARFYAPDDAPRGAAIAALGAALFFDSRLSPSRTRSCASCHAPRRAFTDGRALPSLLETHPGAIVRNTPSLVGVATQPDLFADERAHFLEDQITDVLGSASEMGGSLDQAASVLRADTAYRRWFAAAFADGEDAAVTPRRVRFAIASYLRGIPANHSRFDRAIAGDSGALSPVERQGFNLFMGRAGCGTCHFPPGFSGATPPTLVESEPEVLGVPVRWPARRLAVDSDPGRWGVRRTLTNRGAFKTPTLRNVAVTGPYMHNGAFRTIDEVIDFYDAGGGAGLGLSVPNQTLPADSLHLTRSEKRSLIAFMRALTDSAYAPR
ncbi:MAG TPA: cytochrome c peroxidase, partial [Gemmatimonadaceae bacterium]|nr:cytochrome c peroxidase [Gemmatimonadaceae bacterium]